MYNVFEFFSKLLDSNNKTPRWDSGNWSDFLGTMFILSDLCIGIAFILVPVFMFYNLSDKDRKAERNYSTIFLLFAAFFIMTGINYFVDIVMFWIPAYRLSTIARFATASLSVVAVYFLIRFLPLVIKPKPNSTLAKETELRLEAERKLAIANADLEKFAYVASHDLQEPLRKIVLYAEMLGKRNQGQFDDHSAELLQKISGSSLRMQRLVSDVLSLSMISRDVLLEDVEVKKVVESALEDLGSKIIERKAIVTIGDLPVVKGNKEYLHQLFYNLIGNAVKFSNDHPEISITGTTVDGRAYIAVADKGIGIDDAYFEKIFLPFQRLNASAKFEGSGIGLSLCKKIINIHGGDIKVESTPGTGSTFIAELASANSNLPSG